jgi:hypothetical protein
MKLPKIIKFKQATKEDIKKWIAWAEKEIKAYQRFIKWLKSRKICR